MQILADRRIPLYAWPDDSTQPAARFAHSAGLDYTTWHSQAFQTFERLSVRDQPKVLWVDLHSRPLNGGGGKLSGNVPEVDGNVLDGAMPG